MGLSEADTVRDMLEGKPDMDALRDAVELCVELEVPMEVALPELPKECVGAKVTDTVGPSERVGTWVGEVVELRRKDDPAVTVGSVGVLRPEAVSVVDVDWEVEWEEDGEKEEEEEVDGVGVKPCAKQKAEKIPRIKYTVRNRIDMV